MLLAVIETFPTMSVMSHHGEQVKNSEEEDVLRSGLSNALCVVWDYENHTSLTQIQTQHIFNRLTN